MSTKTKRKKVADTSSGSDQSRVREYNERLVMSLVRKHGHLAKSEIARQTRLSPQTVSVIMRALEADDLLLRGQPVRGKVGQPSIPMSLNPEGVFSIGLKIGRRSATLILLDFVGQERMSLLQAYAYPTPHAIVAFAISGVARLLSSLDSEQQARVAGIGIAMPFELWNWAEKVGAPQAEMDAWREFDLSEALSANYSYPIYIQNDATAACGAELVFGGGVGLSDFVYFYIGSFIGGGIVLNQAIYPGRTGFAGALGSMPIIVAGGKSAQLIDNASIFNLEFMLKKAAIDPSPLWLSNDGWSNLGEPLDQWIADTSKYLALAIVSACAVIDFEAAIVDGGFPEQIRALLVDSTLKELQQLDLQGIHPPAVLEGQVGSEARAVGGACLPLYAHYLLDKTVLLKAL